MSDLYIDIHGASHHHNVDKDYQEQNVGAGLRWEEQSEGRRLMTIVGAYLNSNDHRSIYIAKGVRYPVIKYVEAGGLVGFVSGYWSVPVPSAVAVVSIGTEAVRLNIMALPPINDVTPLVFMASMQIRI